MENNLSATKFIDEDPTPNLSSFIFNIEKHMNFRLNPQNVIDIST